MLHWSAEFGQWPTFLLFPQRGHYKITTSRSEDYWTLAEAKYPERVEGIHKYSTV